jgi:hypothetical protein
MTDSNREEMVRLETATASLARDIQPERDLWPGISASITAATPAGSQALHWWQSPIVVAASLMIAASALTFALTRPEMQQPPAVADRGTPAYAIDSGYLVNRNRLKNKLDGRISSLSPEMQALVRENLESIQGSMNQISMALSKDPGNADLQDLLLGTYEQELQVMTELSQLPEASTRRIDL